MIERSQEVVKIALHGEFDRDSRERLTSLLAPAEVADTVILDLANVEYFDSSAIGCLVGLAARVSARGGGAIQLIRVQPGVRRLVTILGLDQLFALDAPAG